ncbi:hypothetical protein SLITO_v1c04610 [Spiroplasma litorale]|uniref:Transmembrane protein n=1 Tax=Spiroplasma litorale TaxID=216942 RepID=A0A0K1W1B2_9MOLU|nr:hypothetical protein [Spiroplasma litorale]AKX34114.1 hypothetical protein SLITO_v1c04610 [Spiroplasma litorale]
MKASWIVLLSSFLITLLTSVLILTLSDKFGYKYYTFFEGSKFPSKDNQVFIWLIIYIAVLAVGLIMGIFTLIANLLKIDKYNRIMNYSFMVIGLLLIIFGIFLIVAGARAQSSDKEAVISLSMLCVFLPISISSICFMSIVDFKTQK